MRMLLPILGVVSALGGGCTTLSPSVPVDYIGPTATIKDTVKTHMRGKIEFFYLSEIDGKKIEDSRSKTLRDNEGRGTKVTMARVERPVVAAAAVFTIIGRTEYYPLGRALISPVYQVKGKIQFSPEADKTYRILGELGESYSAVWIEEESTHQVVGEKIEANGSAKLGILEK